MYLGKKTYVAHYSSRWILPCTICSSIPGASGIPWTSQCIAKTYVHNIFPSFSVSIFHPIHCLLSFAYLFSLKKQGKPWYESWRGVGDSGRKNTRKITQVDPSTIWNRTLSPVYLLTLPHFHYPFPYCLEKESGKDIANQASYKK